MTKEIVVQDTASTPRFIINGGGKLNGGGFKDFEKILNGGSKLTGGGNKI